MIQLRQYNWFPIAVSWLPVPFAYLLGVAEYGLAATALLLTVSLIGEQSRTQP